MIIDLPIIIDIVIIFWVYYTKLLVMNKLLHITKCTFIDVATVDFHMILVNLSLVIHSTFWLYR